jgi:hypothetical protein
MVRSLRPSRCEPPSASVATKPRNRTHFASCRRASSVWRPAGAAAPGSCRKEQCRSRRTRAQPEVLRRLPPRCPGFDCFDHAFTQVLRIWLRHRSGPPKPNQRLQTRSPIDTWESPNSNPPEFALNRTSVTSAMCPVWTAPGWQGDSSRRRAWSMQPCVRPDATQESSPSTYPRSNLELHDSAITPQGGAGPEHGGIQNLVRHRCKNEEERVEIQP